MEVETMTTKNETRHGRHERMTPVWRGALERLEEEDTAAAASARAHARAVWHGPGEYGLYEIAGEGGASWEHLCARCLVASTESLCDLCAEALLLSEWAPHYVR